MNERIEKLKAAQEKDRQKLEVLKERVQKRAAQIEELEKTELMNHLRVLSARGFSVEEIVAAIQNKDIDTLALLLEEPEGGAT